MDIKKIYTENGKVIKEYFVHKEDAKEVASKIGIYNDDVSYLAEVIASHNCVLVEQITGFTLLVDGDLFRFKSVSDFWKEDISKPIIGDLVNAKLKNTELDDVEPEIEEEK